MAAPTVGADVDDNVVNAPALGVVEPIDPGVAHVPPDNVAAFTVVLQVNPVPDV